MQFSRVSWSRDFSLRNFPEERLPFRRRRKKSQAGAAGLNRTRRMVFPAWNFSAVDGYCYIIRILSQRQPIINNNGGVVWRL